MCFVFAFGLAAKGFAMALNRAKKKNADMMLKMKDKSEAVQVRPNDVQLTKKMMIVVASHDIVSSAQNA